jgi:hypothetical protein
MNDLIAIFFHLLICVAGILLLMFNKRLGEYAAANFNILPSIPLPWFPRISVIVIGVMLVASESSNLYDALMTR